MFRFIQTALVLALIALLWGCGQSDRGDPAGGCVGDGCVVIDHGSVSTGTNTGTATASDAGTDASGTAVDVSGTVYLILSTTFGNPSGFTEKATVSTTGVSGSTVSDDYDGSGSAVFELADVPAGSTWLRVEPQSGSSAMNTYSASVMSSGASLSVPVVDRTVMNLVVGMTTAGVLNNSRAQVVLQLYQNSLPAAGVYVSKAVGADAVAYDQGSGYYAETSATANLGFAILLNVIVPATSSLTVHLTDSASATYAITLPVAADTVTLASVELQ